MSSRARAVMTASDSRARTGAAPQRGVTLLEMIIVLFIAALMMGAFVMEMRYQTDNNTTTNLATGLERIYNGAHAYVTRNFTALSGSADPEVAGFANPMHPTVAELKAAHFLTHGDSEVGYTGGHWQVRIEPHDRALCPGPTCDLDLLVYLDRPLSREGHAALDLAAGAALKAKVPAGFSGLAPYSGQITGLQRSWSVPNPVPNAPGVLGALGGITAHQFSVYLPRSGALPMQGDLRMKDENGQEHSITGVRNLSATGDIYAGGKIEANEALDSNGGIFAKEGIASEGNLQAGGNVIVSHLILTGDQVEQAGQACGHPGAIARDGDGTVFTCSPRPGQRNRLAWDPLPPPAGTLCGVGTIEGYFDKKFGEHNALCKGDDPAQSCPAGYERIHFYNGLIKTDIYVCAVKPW